MKNTLIICLLAAVGLIMIIMTIALQCSACKVLRETTNVRKILSRIIMTISPFLYYFGMLLAGPALAHYLDFIPYSGKLHSFTFSITVWSIISVHYFLFTKNGRT